MGNGPAEHDGVSDRAPYDQTFVVEQPGLSTSGNVSHGGPHFLASSDSVVDPSLRPTISPVTGVGQASNSSGEFELAPDVDVESVVRELQPASINRVGMSLRERFCKVFGIIDDPADAHAQSVLTKVDNAANFSNGRRTAALREAIGELVGPLEQTITQLYSGGLEKNPKDEQQFIRFEDGRQVFNLGSASAGGQGSVQIVVNPALSPADPDLFQVVKIPGKNVRVTLHPETHEFDSIGRAHDQPLEEPIARLNTEAAILQLLSDRGLNHISPRLIDRTVTATGAPALVSEYIRGRDLNALVKEGVKLTPQAMNDIMAVLASHLHELHTLETDSQENTNGVVHRDLKPANIMLTADGQVRIIDFGLARYRGSEIITQLGAHTRTNTVAGTGAFMAPEQVGDVRHASYSADTYSLAATMVYLVTGKPLYDGANDVEMALKHANVELQPDDALQAMVDAGVDPAVVDLVRKCLNKAVDETSGQKRLARKQDGRPTMQEILATLAPRTTWGKRSSDFRYPEGFTKGVKSGSVRISGMLSSDDARSIGITKPLPDGFNGRQEFVETFAKQYPVEAQQVETKKKVSSVLPRVVLAATAFTALTAATMMYGLRGGKEANGDMDTSGLTKGGSTAPENPGTKLRTSPEVVNIPGSCVEIQVNSETLLPSNIILFKGQEYEFSVDASNFLPLKSNGTYLAYAARVNLNASTKLLGLKSVEENNPSFKKNNGTGIMVYLNPKTSDVFLSIPGIGMVYQNVDAAENEDKVLVYPGVDTDMRDFPDYNPKIAIEGRRVQNDQDFYSHPGVKDFMSTFPDLEQVSADHPLYAFEGWLKGNLKVSKESVERYATK